MNSYTDVLQYLLDLDPDFEGVWNSETNYNREDDGSSTICGVLTEFGQYLQDHEDLSSCTFLKSLFDFIELHTDEKSDLGSSIRVCFLENLAHTKAGKYLEKYMGSRSYFYYDGGSFGWNT